MNAPDGAEENLSLDAVIREGLAAAERGETVDLGSFAQYADDEPEPPPSLAAMVEKMRRGEPVDHDVMFQALLAKAKELGISGKLAGQVAGRARWDAERRAAGENRGDGE